ncbi:MAG TPA: hypothetical protein VIF62_19645, partial [Labilithrix sp.]
MRTRIVVIGSVALLLVAARAAAGETLRIETLEERSWSSAVAALQKDRASEGKVIHVVVRESDGTRVKCGSYAIGLDVASAEAFQSEGCDATSDSTALRLVHRSALFDHSESVSKPRAPRIVASRTQTGEASGGAKNGVESTVDCQVTVHPFIRDLENGARIELTPSHYALHTKSDDVRVKPTDDGWVFVAPRGTTSVVHYTVTDSKKGEVVLDDRVSMNCSAQSQVGTSLPPEPEPIPRAPESLEVKPYEPPPDADRANDERRASGSWDGYGVTANLGIGSAFMRTTGVRYGNDAGGMDANALGLHDSAGPVVLASVAYERPGLYGAFGASAG